MNQKKIKTSKNKTTTKNLSKGQLPKFDGNQNNQSTQAVAFEELQQIEKRRPELIDKDIESLKKMKLQAIEELQFEYSQDIQRYITLISSDNFMALIHTCEEYLLKMVYQLFLDFDNNIIQINDMKDSNEILIRSEIQAIYEEVKKRHMKEIENVLFSQKIALLRSENRQPKDVFILREQSKMFATMNNIKEAQLTLNQAEIVFQTNQNTSKNLILTKFNKIIGQITAKQRAELDILQEKLQSSLAENEMNHEELIQDQIRRAENSIRYGLKQAINDGCRELNNIGQRQLISKSLTEFMCKILKESTNPLFPDIQI